MASTRLTEQIVLRILRDHFLRFRSILFLPTTKKELNHLGWDTIDIILITGDSYIDSPFIGISVIGRILLKAGFRVGIIAQPNVDSYKDICRLGEPKLFWGVSGGSVDSMVANYTPTKKRRKSDDFTPGGLNNRRPDRAIIAYTNLIKKNFKNTKPIVLGGIEASLRRISHYDFWSNNVRRSILFDAKGDYLIYGMAEKSITEFAHKLRKGEDVKDIPGLCYISKTEKDNYIKLPSYKKSAVNKHTFITMFDIFYSNNDPYTAKGLIQKQDTRYLVQNPPGPPFSRKELDDIYGMPFERDLHPFYKKQGKVKALDTIKFSITTHRGCYGECNFCAISIHQGKIITGRSNESIIKEALIISEHPDFKGIILDVGGPTANMYGFECKKKLSQGSCKNRRCLFPKICPQLKIDHSNQLTLLKKIANLKNIKKVFIASGVRYDLVLNDKKSGFHYIERVISHHISGQMKVAPEHFEKKILLLMGKVGTKSLFAFKNMFYQLTKLAGKKQFLTYYLMAAHPGCNEQDMRQCKKVASQKLKTNPEQVQIFTPTPSTYSSLMYHTEINPFTGEKIFVEKNTTNKEKQKKILVRKHSDNHFNKKDNRKNKYHQTF